MAFLFALIKRGVMGMRGEFSASGSAREAHCKRHREEGWFGGSFDESTVENKAASLLSTGYTCGIQNDLTVW